MWSNMRNKTVQTTPIMWCTIMIKASIDVVCRFSTVTEATTNAITAVETKQLTDVHSLLKLILRLDSPQQELFILEKVKFVTLKIIYEMNIHCIPQKVLSKNLHAQRRSTLLLNLQFDAKIPLSMK